MGRHPGVSQSTNHVNAVSGQRISVLAKAVEETRSKTRRSDSLDIHLGQTSEHLRKLVRSLSQRERLRRLEVEEDTGKDDRQSHPELMFGEDALWILFRLQW